MERRGFLKGVFGGLTAAGLVVTATPKELEAFAAPLVKHEPLLLDVPPVKPLATSIGEHLYNSDGDLVAIVTEIQAVTEMIDVTRAGEPSRAYVKGLTEMRISAIGIGPL